MPEDIDASLRELATLLDRLAACPIPPPRPRLSPVEYHDAIQMQVWRSGIQSQIDRIKGVGQLREWRYQEDRRDLDGPYVRHIIAYLKARLGLTTEQAESLTVAKAVEALESLPGDPPAGQTKAAQRKRTRGPRRISKVQRAIAILTYRKQKRRESIRVEDIAREAECTPQNLYKSPDFKEKWKRACDGRIRRGWKIEGIADCPDDSTLEMG
jgi:hypothetical protein